MTWGEFKRQVEKRLADGLGDEEELLSISWSGLEDPAVVFKATRQGSHTANVVLIT